MYEIENNLKKDLNQKLWQAVDSNKANKLRFVKKYLKQGADSNYSSYITLLGLAAYHDNKDIAKLLIKAGADINAVGSNNKTPIVLALEEASSNVLDYLIELKADINLKENDKDIVDIAIECLDLKYIKYNYYIQDQLKVPMSIIHNVQAILKYKKSLEGRKC